MNEHYRAQFTPICHWILCQYALDFSELTLSVDTGGKLMKNTARILITSFLAVSLLSACSDSTRDKLNPFNCLASDTFDIAFEFENDDLDNATLGLEYTDRIRTNMDEDDFDDIDINFSISAGSLPDGLMLEETGDRLYVVGVPQETGSFLFEVRATAEQDDCSDERVSKNYEIVVLESNVQ